MANSNNKWGQRNQQETTNEYNTPYNHFKNEYGSRRVIPLPGPRSTTYAPPCSTPSANVIEEAKKQTLDRALTALGLAITAVIIIGILLVSWYLSWRRQKDYQNWTQRNQLKRKTEKPDGPLTPEEAKEAAKKATLAVAAATTGRRESELLTLVKRQQKLLEAKELLAVEENHFAPREDACVETGDSLLEYPLQAGSYARNPHQQQQQQQGGRFPLVIDTRHPKSLETPNSFRRPGNSSLEYAVVNEPPPPNKSDLSSNRKNFLLDCGNGNNGKLGAPPVPIHAPEAGRYSSMGFVNELSCEPLSSQQQWMAAPMKATIGNRGYDSLGRMGNSVPNRQAYSAGNTPLIPGSNRASHEPLNFGNLQQVALAAGYSPNLGGFYQQPNHYGIYVNADDYRPKVLNPIYSSVQGPESFTVASQHDALLNELFQRGEVANMKPTNQGLYSTHQPPIKLTSMGNHINQSSGLVNKSPYPTQLSSQTISLAPHHGRLPSNPPRSTANAYQFHQQQQQQQQQLNSNTIMPIGEVPLMRGNHAGYHQVQMHNSMAPGGGKVPSTAFTTSLPGGNGIRMNSQPQPNQNAMPGGRISRLPETVVPNAFRLNR